MSGNRIHEKGPMESGFSEIQREDGTFHRTLYNNQKNNHISWNADKNGDYIKGTGHEDLNNRPVNQWDRKDEDYPRHDDRPSRHWERDR